MKKSQIELASIELIADSVKELKRKGWNDNEIYEYLTEKRYIKI